MKKTRNSPPTRRGRPRDSHIDDVVLDAVDDALRDAGPAALTIAEVARRAKVGKPALYRRWPNREHLLMAALERRVGAVEVIDTGCTLCDLHEVIDLAGRAYATLGPEVVAQLLVEAGPDRVLRTTLIETLLAPTRAAVRSTLVAAAGRGDLRLDLAPTAVDLAADSLCALVFHRLLLGAPPLAPDEIEATVVGLLRGLAANPEDLLAQYDGPVSEGTSGRPHGIDHRR